MEEGVEIVLRAVALGIGPIIGVIVAAMIRTRRRGQTEANRHE